MPMVKAVNPANPAQYLMAVNGGKKRSKNMARKKAKAAKKSVTTQSRSASHTTHRRNPAKQARRRARRSNPSADVMEFVATTFQAAAGAVIGETVNGLLPPSTSLAMEVIKKGAIAYGLYWGLPQTRLVKPQTAKMVAVGAAAAAAATIIRPLFNRVTSFIAPQPQPQPVQVAPNARPQVAAGRGVSGIAASICPGRCG